MSALSRMVKRMLWPIGARLTSAQLYQIQGAVNSLKLGRWMHDHGFHFDRILPDRWQVFDVVIDRVRDRRVLYLEFGVFKGRTIRYWAGKLTHPETRLHGFDSFEGLPDAWGPHTKGAFSVEGQIPQVDDPRVRFFKGWFEDTLADYQVPEHDVLVMIMDADLYASTAFVFTRLRPYIRPGTFIYFDEMNHVEDEPRAFEELIQASGLRFSPVCADRSMQRAIFECVG
jgi:hypothetical protein